jgi:hypothetical protein
MGGPSIFVWITLALYVPFVFVAFWQLGPRRGMIVSILAGWMFLPYFDGYGKQVPLLHTKRMFVPAVILAASILTDARRWSRLRFRLRLADLPVLAMVAVYPIASWANGLGAYETGSAGLESVLAWGVPYLLGRLYLTDERAVREFARALATAALLYVPLCLWEIRMSPQLHRELYGFYQSAFMNAMRYGGYRPMVFMQTGLMLAWFIGCGTLAAYWLWRTRASSRVLGIPMMYVAGVLGVTLVLCKSTGALFLTVIGILVLEAATRFRSYLLIIALAVVPPLYCAARTNGWSGELLIQQASRWVNADRAWSLRYRINNEDLLIWKALQKPWTGWSRGSFQVVDERGRLVSVSDGLWIIVLGSAGIPGLVALLSLKIAPVLALGRRVKARQWANPALAAPAILCIVLLLTAVDDLLNAMETPVYAVSAGAVVSIALGWAARRRARSRLAAGQPDPATRVALEAPDRFPAVVSSPGPGRGA